MQVNEKWNYYVHCEEVFRPHKTSPSTLYFSQMTFSGSVAAVKMQSFNLFMQNFHRDICVMLKFTV